MHLFYGRTENTDCICLTDLHRSWTCFTKQCIHYNGDHVWLGRNCG